MSRIPPPPPEDNIDESTDLRSKINPESKDLHSKINPESKDLHSKINPESKDLRCKTKSESKALRYVIPTIRAKDMTQMVLEPVLPRELIVLCVDYAFAPLPQVPRLTPKLPKDESTYEGKVKAFLKQMPHETRWEFTDEHGVFRDGLGKGHRMCLRHRLPDEHHRFFAVHKEEGFGEIWKFLQGIPIPTVTHDRIMCRIPQVKLVKYA